MPPMPYNLEKGPYLSMFEDLFNESPEQMYQCLQYVREPGSLITGLLYEFPATIPAGGPYRTTQELAVHINRDWFGLPANPERPFGFDEVQPPYDPAHHSTTGFWNSWYGNSNAIVRTLYIRAFEIALGLTHDEVLPEEGPPYRRHWRMNLFTVCGIRWFEGWLNWRKLGDDPGAGIVTVILLTPSHGRAANPDLLRHFTTDKPGHDPYALNPTTATGDQGLWVVGLRNELQQDAATVFATEWTGLGQISIPRLGPTYVGSGDVVVVAPPEGEGGVLPAGRNYKGASR